MVLAAIGVAWAFLVFADAFATIILPKTVSRGFRLTQIFYRVWWMITKMVARRLHGDRRESFLGITAPLSTIALIAIWAISLILAFSLIQYGLSTPVTGEGEGFGPYLYLSATTFFTLGYGDVTATNTAGRVISMLEAGVGFGFLAVVIGFLPVFYQSYSNREHTELLLDARAGAPPMAGELLRFQGNDLTGLRELFAEYERWAAGLLENFLSYPILAFYRSQHAQLSWLACLVCVADACAFVLATYPEDSEDERSLKRQAAVTFAIARHLAVDYGYVLNIEPDEGVTMRLDLPQFKMLMAELEARGVRLSACEEAWSRLSGYAQQLDPFFFGIAEELLLEIPSWMPMESRLASWQTSAWDGDGHF